MKMELAILHKFSQHEGLREELLSTGDAELIEVCGCLLVFHPALTWLTPKSELR